MLWVAAVVASLGLAACSLLGLGDFDIPTCSESAAGRSRCQVLDDRDHIPASACYHWQCRSDGRPGCELAPKDYDGDGHPDELACKELEATRNLDCDDTRAERYNDNVEICDGFDNNCNGVVDEGTLDDRAGSQDTGWLDHTVFADKPVELALVAQQAPESVSKPLLSVVTNRGGWLLDPIGETAVAIHYDSALAIEPSPKPCPRSNASSVLCNMRQLSLSAGPTNILGAAVTDDAGCADGELRIGIGLRTAAALSLYLGSPDKGVPNNLQYGVDIDNATHCPAIGVRDPRIAGLHNQAGEQALVLWVERSVGDTSDSCASERVRPALRGIGVWAVSGDRPTVVATGGGRSQVIARSSSGAAPALIAIMRSAAPDGYLAAFGEESGRLSLMLFAALPGRNVSNSVTSDVILPTPRPYGEPRAVDHVSLAIETPRAERDVMRFAAAYRSGCGDKASISLSLFALADDTPTDPESLATLTIAEPGRVDASMPGPWVAYVPEGFIAPKDSDVSTGGWLVLWVDKDGGSVRGTRVSRDARVLDAQPFRVLNTNIDALAVFTDARGRISYLGVNRNTHGALLGAPSCSTK